MHSKLTANTLERRQLLSYKNQSIPLHSKSMDWFLDSGNKCCSSVFVVNFEHIQLILAFLNTNPH